MAWAADCRHVASLPFGRMLFSGASLPRILVFIAQHSKELFLLPVSGVVALLSFLTACKPCRGKRFMSRMSDFRFPPLRDTHNNYRGTPSFCRKKKNRKFGKSSGSGSTESTSRPVNKDVRRTDIPTCSMFRLRAINAAFVFRLLVQTQNSSIRKGKEESRTATKKIVFDGFDQSIMPHCAQRAMHS